MARRRRGGNTVNPWVLAGLLVAGLVLASHAAPHRAAAGHGARTQAVISGATRGGTLDCAGLEALWEAAGGSPGAARMAASIAMAESAGHQYTPDNSAQNNTGLPDVGYWQVNGIHGALATTDPVGNAKAAIYLSDNGRNWGPWVTYNNGAYAGQC